MLSRLGYPSEDINCFELNGVKVALPIEPPDPSRLGGLAVGLLGVSAHNPSPNATLLRVRGVAFEDEVKLKAYIEFLRELRARDHRFLGRKLDLFTINELSGPGLPLFHPKGMVVWRGLVELIREVNRRLGYMEVYTPHVYRAELWRVSGHYHLYRDKMLIFKVGDEEYGVKPMNCPGHILIYKSRPRSYRELPIRYSEFGTVYRWEQSGELYGLLRVRGFTQDDGHAFLREDQVKDEVKAIIREVYWILRLFGFREGDVRVSLSTRPEKSIGTEEQWRKATEALMEALEELGIQYTVKEGEGAFYGPKVDVDFRDSLGRWWQCSTIQVDFALPERFDLTYKGPDGTLKRPVMIHRALLGSIERFMAIIIENYAGKLPTWLAPIQVAVLPITRRQEDYAIAIHGRLVREGFRAEIWDASTTVSRRIKRSYELGIPYIVIVGRGEEELGKITVRGRGNVEARLITLGQFIEVLKREVETRSPRQLLTELTSKMEIQG